MANRDNRKNKNNRRNRHSIVTSSEDNENLLIHDFANRNKQLVIDDNIQANQHRFNDINQRMIEIELHENNLQRNNHEKHIDFSMLRRMTPEEIKDMVSVE
jgi:hypothetical protein